MEPIEDFERKADHNLQNDLRKEASGILAWMVRGCLEYQGQGLNPPDTVKAATAAYRLDEDLIGTYISDSLLVSEDKVVRAEPLYRVYRYCGKDMGHHPMSGTRFGKEMKKRFQSDRDSKGVFYKGLKFKT